MEMNGRRMTTLGLGLAAVIGVPLSAQTQALPFSEEGWMIQGPTTSVEAFRGVETLRTQNGSAARVDLPVEDGTFEFDLSLPRARGFVGFRFRMDAFGNAEEIYFRPHKGKSPDALQYAPVFAAESYWQVFHGPASTARVDFPEGGDWLHVRLVVAGETAVVYLDGSAEPAMVSRLARDPTAGFFAVYATYPPVEGEETPFVSVANFTMTPGAPTVPLPTPPPALEPPGGLIRTWILSPAFRWTGGLPTEAPGEIVASEERSEASVDPSGILVVGRYRQRNLQGGEMGVLARVKVTSERPQVKRLDLGFSDAAGVFLNGRLVYAGDDSYSENFPRRQGLVTLNQASLFLPLEEGENEITVLVVDAMGGWAVGGVFADPSGLRLH